MAAQKIGGPNTARWQRRTLAAWVLRALAFLLPVVAGVAAAVVTGMALPAAASFGEAAAHWVLMLCISLAVVLLVDAASRQILPLAALLELSLLFPGDAPSRFRVALRAGNTRSLEHKLAKAREDGDTDLARYAGLVLALATSISEHDRKTRGHSERVRAYADLIAEEVGLTPDERDRLRWAALLHDVGKLEVPGEVLNKDGKPDEEEWSIIRAHPAIGAQIAAPLAPWLGRWSETIAQHHERVDGEGYPRGLTGDEICLGARIVAVADAYETMTSVRSYKDPVSPEVARAELAACAGSQFDPEVVRAFMNVSVADLRHVMAPITVLLDVPLVRGLAGVAEPLASGVTTAAAVTALSVAGTVGSAPDSDGVVDPPDMARTDIARVPVLGENIGRGAADTAHIEVQEGMRSASTPRSGPVPAEAHDGEDIADEPAAMPAAEHRAARTAQTDEEADAQADATDTDTAGTGASTDDGSRSTTRTTSDADVGPELPSDISADQPDQPRDRASPDTIEPPVVQPPDVPDEDQDSEPDLPQSRPTGVPPSDPPPSAPPPVEPPVGDPPVDLPEPPVDAPGDDSGPGADNGKGPLN